MTVEEKKCSGNAQYLKQGRIMHHGTILYDSDLGVLFQALNGSKDKIESKGIKSVRSPVTNIRPYMKTDMPISGFWAALKECMFTAFNLREYTLSPEENAEVEKLREQTYSQWNWNYGASPPYQVRKTRCIEGCGKFDMLLDVEKEGIIKALHSTMTFWVTPIQMH
jgi:lipoate-protein ligase A